MNRTYILRTANYHFNDSAYDFDGFEMKRVYASYEEAEAAALLQIRNDWSWMNLCCLGNDWHDITYSLPELAKFYEDYGIKISPQASPAQEELYIPDNINDYELRILLRMIKFPFFEILEWAENKSFYIVKSLYGKDVDNIAWEFYARSIFEAEQYKITRMITQLQMNPLSDHFPHWTEFPDIVEYLSAQTNSDDTAIMDYAFIGQDEQLIYSFVQFLEDREWSWLVVEEKSPEQVFSMLAQNRKAS